MNLRISTMLMTALACASVAAARSSSASPSTLFALSTLQNPPPVAQPPRVPGEPPRPPQSPPVSRQPESPKNDQITVAGCIEQGQAQASTKEPSATGTSGTSGQASGTSKVSKFILTNPKLQGASAGTPNSSTSSRSRASGGMYQLDARDSKLSPHVGHQVEVTGSIKAGSTSSASGPDAPKLKVENIKMISTSCGSPSSPASTPAAR
jgi:hypothetical protein